MSLRRRLVCVGLMLVFAAGAPAFAQKRTSPLIPGGNSKEPVQIEADKLEYFDKDQKAVYTGNVIAKQGDSTLRCQTLTILIDRSSGTAATAAAAPPAAGPTENSQIKRMEAGGPVTISSKDQVGTGDSGVYDKAEDKLYLIGHVTLTQGKNVTSGDKLTYDLASGQALIGSGHTQGRVKAYFVPGAGQKGQTP